MVNRECAGVITLYQRKTWARYFFRHAQMVKDGARQRRLPRSELSGQRDKIAGFENFGDSRAQHFRCCLVGEEEAGFELHHKVFLACPLLTLNAAKGGRRAKLLDCPGGGRMLTATVLHGLRYANRDYRRGPGRGAGGRDALLRRLRRKCGHYRGGALSTLSAPAIVQSLYGGRFCPREVISQARCLLRGKQLQIAIGRNGNGDRPECQNDCSVR